LEMAGMWEFGGRWPSEEDKGKVAIGELS